MNIDDLGKPKLVSKKEQAKHVGLPPRFFLYTLDQIATVLNIKLETLNAKYVYFEGRSTYVKKTGQMSARNIAPVGEPPTWRVLDTELIRWMKFKGFRYYEQGVFYETTKYNEG